ncbi:pseudouridine synthase [Desulfurispira natronophila]|uniref:Pseudouridine synthase n=1 Tax=Desulfurispira natronophila TaxID=682562 RepID=A0A7W7Y5V1_9BACT|nr:pseudouridine synthase [Desulfurispira natronophila]MBB5022613.1 pseudouridine synthase [Desulfurispira natronophila]
MEIRLQKILAQAGVASRRKAEEFIVEGRVMVNGKKVTELGAKADPDHDFIAVDGKKIDIFRSHTYIILHKPTGYITSTSDDKERPVVMELLPNSKERLVPVGRLDWDSSGLLILTNDGDLAYIMTHPAFHVPKTYMVRLDMPLKPEHLRQLEQGVEIDGRRTQPAKLRLVNTGNQKKATNQWYEITITEGRNRQVRRMFETVGYTVRKLKRTSVGDILLGGIATGKYRYAEPWEIEYFAKLKQQKLDRK